MSKIGLISLLIAALLLGVMKASAQPDRLIKQLVDSLPAQWEIMNIPDQNEIIVQSRKMELYGNSASNDPYVLEDYCRIEIFVLPLISKDSFKVINRRNKKVRENLPNQISKEYLVTWYAEHKNDLSLLLEEPNHFDGANSYRVSSRHVPKNEKDKKDYDAVFRALNKLLKSYDVQ